MANSKWKLPIFATMRGSCHGGGSGIGSRWWIVAVGLTIASPVMTWELRAHSHLLRLPSSTWIVFNGFLSAFFNWVSTILLCEFLCCKWVSSGTELFFCSWGRLIEFTWNNDQNETFFREIKNGLWLKIFQSMYSSFHPLQVQSRLLN